ncbi:hypothetical protein [Thalassovita mediterranea]|uniref:Uncharacterized protein n=1 Tax=Thalassovita mediterranea TaxID=340021 RepID=A0A0P1GP51_9RHOB|nr:hypothetical protein [Thalassovita mediterranea]CUH84296.1 hypothetical protein TM5383_01504 [Thalassovita mediterranea]SIS27483.1 hypothetical protein SAMN05421685_1015 [Thalassovita mediterranea]
MREVFGGKLRRKLSRTGLQVCNINYQSDALMQMFLREPGVEVDILCWDGDIGAISVRADRGAWMTVPASDERWIGRTDLDLRAELASVTDEDDTGERARRDFINSANDESYRLKRLAGLISLPQTTDDLDYEVGRFMRHADTAERRRRAGGYRDLMGDLGDLPISESTTDQFDTTPGAVLGTQDSNDHTMG